MLMRSRRLHTILAASAFAFVVSLSSLPCHASARMYTLVHVSNGYDLYAPNGKMVFEYVTVRPTIIGLEAPSAAYFDPVNTPSGVRVTNVAPSDFRWHRGIFFGFMNSEFHIPDDYSNAPPTHPVRGYEVERGDFWAWGVYAPRKGRVIKNISVKLIDADAHHAHIEIHNVWLINNRKMLNETDEAIVSEQYGMYVIDLYYRIAPLYDYKILQTAFGGFSFQAQKLGESYYTTAAGKVTLPDPHYSYPLSDWPSEPWYDYTITLASNGKTVGAAVIDHPLNPPTLWHNPRNIHMLAPCITALRSITIHPELPLILRYRVVVHDGPPQIDAIQKLAEQWRALNENPFVHPTQIYPNMLPPHSSYDDEVLATMPN